jgi:taurine dioxygenase
MKKTIRVTPLSLALGAEISNIDLRQTLNDQTWKTIKKAFDDYSVLVFREQHITVDDQKRFAEYFGDLFIHEHLLPFTLEGHPECMMLHNDDKTPPGLNYWHTDNSGWKKPPLGTMLYAKTTPRIGGDTLFSSMYKAYDALSKPVQDFIKPLKAVHDVKKAFGAEYGNLKKALKKQGIDPESHFDSYEPILHPMVRTHPETKKLALYISEPYITGIEGLSLAESKMLLNFLYHHIQTQEFIYRHRWQPNDLVIWDNRCTQHYATADYFPFERLMHRMNICGEVPT